MAHQTGLQFTLTLAGASDLDLAVVGFTHREALSTPFELEVAFASREGEFSPEAFLDRELSLTIWQDGEALRHLHGVTTVFARGDRDHRDTPPRYPRRLLVDACCYVVRSGCSWRMLPKGFPP